MQGALPHKSLFPTDAPKGATQAASVAFIAHNATIWLSSKVGATSHFGGDVRMHCNYDTLATKLLAVRLPLG